MAAAILLTSSTGAGVSAPVVVVTERWVGILAAGFAAPDSAVIEISGDQGATWADTKLVFNFGNPTVRLDKVGTYRVNKGVTVGTPVFYASTEDNF